MSQIAVLKVDAPVVLVADCASELLSSCGVLRCFEVSPKQFHVFVGHTFFNDGGKGARIGVGRSKMFINQKVFHWFESDIVTWLFYVLCCDRMHMDRQPVPVGLIGFETQSLTTAKSRQNSAALICGIALTAYESLMSQFVLLFIVAVHHPSCLGFARGIASERKRRVGLNLSRRSAFTNVARSLPLDL
jgi:hypothetical protein